MLKPSKALQKFLTNIYGFAFFNACVFLYPIYALFFAASGVSDGEISALFIIWSLGTLAAQVPIGIAANRFRHKDVVIFGQLCKIACFVLWYFYPTFLGFTIGFLLWGIQWAAATTVYESIVYEELKHLRRRRLYIKVCSRKSAIETAGYIVSSAGSLMLLLGFGIVTWASCAMVLMSVLFLARMGARAGMSAARNARVKIMRTMMLGVMAIRQSPYVLNLMILAAAFAAVGHLDDFFGLIGTEMGVPAEFVGGVFIMSSLAQSVGQAVSHRFKYVRNTGLYLGVVGLGLVYVLLSAFFTLPGLALIGIFCFGFGVVKVLTFAQFQHAVSSRCRTIMLAMFSAIEQVACIATCAVVGFGAEMGGYRLSVLFIGALVMLLGLWALCYIPEKTIKVNRR